MEPARDAGAHEASMPFERARAFAYVVEAIERAIRAGQIEIGGRLPGERTLAERLQVSRATVREGLRALELFGLVSARRGSGRDSGSHLVAATHEGLQNAWRLHALATGVRTSDLLHPLALVQQQVATELARTHQAAMVARLRIANAELGRARGWTALLDADAAVHALAAQFVADQLASGAAALLAAAAPDLLELLRPLGVEEATARLVCEHTQLIDTIERGDVAMAGMLAYSHALRELQRPARVAALAA
ncbi:GntR family transcriptional regulator [Conexibacter sp. CPCC 206217]|uniref:GntR family transcriptional regulator n=1 Tax=Conexibacter sp. CPCC 206217 TaxID=3064574 RepID=UPI00271FFFA7|nr:GntR family transcriptional regulator [Conexibacter sp. CPCC 206217]MDO8212024.1 GntR family transcriptional regulator [Conexibacter sp. CPCC 206217]